MIIEDKDYGCYLSPDKLGTKIDFMGLSKLKTLLSRSEFDRYRKYNYSRCYYKYCDELILGLRKLVEKKKVKNERIA